MQDPPISNSLMAAIKRSQANQRRNPPDGGFHGYHHHHHQKIESSCCASSSPSSSSSLSSSSILSVKVELQQLILSILDDPVVSRVFADAGFRSCDVKLALLRPTPSSLFRFPRSRCPPLFLCNFTNYGSGDSSDPGHGPPIFNFPFSGVSAFAGFSDLDDNCRRIGEVLVRKKSRNPLLVGVCAVDAVRSFAECLERGGSSAIPQEVSGLKFICLEKWISEFRGREGEFSNMGSRLEELGRVAERFSGPGVVISVGDLNGFLYDAASFVVAELTRLLDLYCGRLWLIGAAANYETYMKFLTRYPSVEKDWDLQLLPITSLKPALGGGLHPRPHSLMESFVPFGGCFSSSSNLKSPISSKCQSMSRCHLCDEKYEQDVAAVMKGSSVSFADPKEESSPSWVHMADLVSTKGLDGAKAKDDGTVLNAKVVWLQKKWNDICQRLHHRNQVLDADDYQVRNHVRPSIVGVPYVAERNGMPDNCNGKSTDTPQLCNGSGNVFPASTDIKKIPLPDMNTPLPVVSESVNEDLTTDLALALVHVPLRKEQSNHELRRHLPSMDEAADGSFSITTVRSTSAACSDSVVQNPSLPVKISPISSMISDQVVTPHQRSIVSSDMTKQFDMRDFKSLWQSLTEKVGRQDEALCAISQTLAHCKMGNERRRGASRRGDVWFNFLGPDRVGKKRIAEALAEVVFGSKHDLICVDLSSQDGIVKSNAIFELSQVINGYDVRFRGKTVVDYIAEEITKRPRSVVFLENVDKADLILQNSLSQAINTGKFPDSRRREIGISNTIFVTTLRTVRGNTFSGGNESVRFSEERILAAQGWQMQILVGDTSEAVGNKCSYAVVSSQSEAGNKESIAERVFVNKRKLGSTDDPETPFESLEKIKRPHRSSNTFLDLNLSIEEMEAKDANYGDDENDSLSESSEAWLEEFIDLVDGTVTLKPFDFDALAVNILKKIGEIFWNMIGPKGLLEIDSRVIEQILAAAWLSDRKGAVENWVEQVLGKSFEEARERYNGSVSSHSVLKVVSLEECVMQEQAPGVCLPARVILK